MFAGCENICNMPECEKEIDIKTGFCNSNRSDCKNAKKIKTKHTKEKHIRVTYVVKTEHDTTSIQIPTVKTACSIVGHNPLYWHTHDNAQKFENWKEKHLNKTEFTLQLKIWGAVGYPRYDLLGVHNACNEEITPSSLIPFVEKCRQLESIEANTADNEHEEE